MSSDQQGDRDFNGVTATKKELVPISAQLWGDTPMAPMRISRCFETSWIPNLLKFALLNSQSWLLRGIVLRFQEERISESTCLPGLETWHQNTHKGDTRFVLNFSVISEHPECPSCSFDMSRWTPRTDFTRPGILWTYRLTIGVILTNRRTWRNLKPIASLVPRLPCNFKLCFSVTSSLLSGKPAGLLSHLPRA